ncbi:MAG: manganese-binding transcriptional regulator MntR [Planctomycetota bacterium]
MKPAPGHLRTRADHATELAEDYVEAIDDFIRSNGVCRSADLVTRFGVTHASVSNTVARLQRDGFATTAPYRPIELTDVGRELAAQSRKRHAVVHDFLLAIGVSEATAEIDSEGMEHHVSDETLRMMKLFLREQADG